jgi:hypothetical protein
MSFLESSRNSNQVNLATGYKKVKLPAPIVELGNSNQAANNLDGVLSPLKISESHQSYCEAHKLREIVQHLNSNHQKPVLEESIGLTLSNSSKSSDSDLIEEQDATRFISTSNIQRVFKIESCQQIQKTLKNEDDKHSQGLASILSESVSSGMQEFDMEKEHPQA